MTASIDKFNSNLLDMVQKHYKGPSYSKLLEGLEVLNTTGSIEEACSFMFRSSSAQIETPSEEAVASYGQGDVSQDYMTLLYIDDFISRSFESIKQENYQDALGIMESNEVFPVVPVPDFPENKDNQWFFENPQMSEMDKIKNRVERVVTEQSKTGRPLVDKARNLPKDLVIRFEIYMGMYKFCKMKQETPSAETYLSFFNYRYQIESLDDLAFSAICGVFDQYFKAQGSTRTTMFNIDFSMGDPSFANPYRILDYGTENINIPSNVLESMGSRPFPNVPLEFNKNFDKFLEFNRQYRIKDHRGDLNNSLSNLLSSSSFIWDKQIFDISPDEIEAMTTEERLLFLTKNKAKVIERTFEYIQYASRSSDLQEVSDITEENKGAITRIGLNVEQTLQEVELEQERYKSANAAKEFAKSSLMDIAQTMGQSSVEALSSIMRTIEKIKTVPELNLSPTNFDQIVIKLLNDYSHNLIQSTVFKNKYNESREKLRKEHQSLRRAFDDYLERLSTNSLDDSRFIKRFLEGYTVFSFIILNDEIFPDAPLSQQRDQAASKKIMKIFDKKSKDEKRIASQAIQKWKDTALGGIGAIINRRVDKIFSAYKPDRSQGKRIRTLSDKDINLIRQVSENINDQAEKGNPIALERFNKMNEVLKNMLLQDESFYGTIDQIYSKISPQKMAELQAFMNACLLFAEGDFARNATGMTPSAGFKRLNDAILYSISDQRIRTKMMNTSQGILKSMEDFSVAVTDEAPMKDAVTDAMNSETQRSLENKTFQIMPATQSPQLAQMNYILDRLKNFIIPRMLEFEGESEFLRKKTPNKQIKSVPFEAIEYKYLHDPSLGLSEDDLSMLSEVYGSRKFDSKEITQAVEQFVLSNDLDTGILNPGSLFYQYLGVQGYHLLGLTAIYQNLQTLENNLRANEEIQEAGRIVPIGQGNPDLQANIFENKPLWDWYKSMQSQSRDNQSWGLIAYQEFLPIFLASYFNDLKSGQTTFAALRKDLLKNLPESEESLSTIVEFLNTKDGQLKSLVDYLQNSIEDDTFFDPTWMSKTYTMIKTQFNINLAELSASFKNDVSEFVMVAVILTAGMAVATGGNLTFAAICGVLGALSWMGKLGPIVKDLLSSAKESMKYLLTDKYTPQGVNRFILDMIRSSFTSEIMAIPKLINKDLKNTSAFILSLQEEFSMFENMGVDVGLFPQRLNHLIAQIQNPQKDAKGARAKNMNYSSLAMNMFYMYNKELFSMLPESLQKGAVSPHYLPAVKEYVSSYIQLIKQEQNRSGLQTEADLSLERGESSPFMRKLQEMEKNGEFKLKFNRGSDVFKFLQNMSSKLNKSSTESIISPRQIVSIDSLAAQVDNLAEFLELSRELLKLQDIFDGSLKTVYSQIQQVARIGNVAPLKESAQEKAVGGLIASYGMVRSLISNAQRSYETIYPTYNEEGELQDQGSQNTWLRAMDTTPQNILTNPLFTESLGLLKKTASVAALSNLEGGQEALEIIHDIERGIENLFHTGDFSLPPYDALTNLLSSITTIVSQGDQNPQLFVPILMEYENNSGFLTSNIIWNQMMNHVNEESDNQASDIIRVNFKSKFFYLTNSDSEIFFADPSMRAFGISPFVVDAMQNILRNDGDTRLMEYMGLMASQNTQLSRVQGAIPKFLSQMRSMMPEGMRSILGGRSAYPTPGQQQPQITSNQPVNTPQNASQVPSYNTPIQEQGGFDFQQPGYDPNVYNQQTPQGYGSSPTPMAQQNQEAQQAGQPQMASPNQQQMQQQAPSIDPRQPQPEQAGGVYPLILPQGYSEGQQEGPIAAPQQQQMEQSLPQQAAPAASAEGQNFVQIGADGSSGAFSNVGPGSEVPGGEEMRPHWEAFNNQLRRNVENPPDRTPYQFLGPGNAPPYQNPLGGFEPVQQAPQSFPWGKTAMVGGGLVAGAVLLSQLLKDDDKKKRK